MFPELDEKFEAAMWSLTGKPGTPSSRPVGRNPEQEPPAKAGGSSRRFGNRPENAADTALGDPPDFDVTSVLFSLG